MGRSHNLAGCAARRIVVAGSIGAVVAAAVQTASHLVNAFVLDGRYPGLDASRQGNLFDWASASAIFAAVCAALVCAIPGRRRLSFLVVAGMLVFLALDEILGIHEALGDSLAPHLPGPLGRLGDLATPLIYLPLLAIVFVLLWRVSAAPGAWRPLRWGLRLLAGAVALRVAAAGIRLTDGRVAGGARDLGAAADQALQLAGWLLVATGLAAVAATASRPS